MDPILAFYLGQVEAALRCHSHLVVDDRVIVDGRMHLVVRCDSAYFTLTIDAHEPAF